MLHSTDRFRATHVGSLPRSEEVHRANAARREGNLSEEQFQQVLARGVAEVVDRQVQVGLDTVNDGEYGHASQGAVDYGSWWNYSFARTDGLEVVEDNPALEPVRSEPGRLAYTSMADRRDRQAFAEAYADPSSIIPLSNNAARPVAVREISYTGQEAVAADVAHLRQAVQASGADEAFLAALSPGSAARIGNRHYATEKEFLWAWADVLHEEYRAITDAGLVVQIDDPGLAEGWDQINPEPSVADYLDFQRLRVEALNHALRGIPPEQVRFHLCWGSWHGPHSTDLPLRHVVELMLEIDAGAYSFEAANPRHAHEWRVWEQVELPAEKLVLPGLVSHSTNVLEHPELVAQRLEQFSRVLPKENIVASTDCGLGGRIHPQIAWAKLASLTEGARIASDRLF